MAAISNATVAAGETRRQEKWGLRKGGNLKDDEENVKQKFLDQIEKKFSSRLKMSYFKCKLCSFVSIREDKAMFHVGRTNCASRKKNKPREEIECVRCGMKSLSSLANRKHYRDKHMEPLTCSKCPHIEFTSRFAKERHIQTTHLMLRFHCDKCEVSFSRSATLAKHMNNHHMEENPFYREGNVEENPFYREGNNID